ncbi:TRAP transporter large permease [Pelagibacterium halotolerans]|uniref:TRAP transporter large permease protein n=1 Tax=Pelagibacterium halotolerans (strain DSM 22347 / JCM 15775 / CGMCC 1.7692 / B2) TaxID=1082931 RepID=G4RC57_PELHB|nr:TRAP transporter large permease [Pelagibacterium halotolerans]AEQ52680.1 TRAP-type C4-dicarboxylate transport system, large permease component [Pelagibacterium halotolerans B2]QJR17617.1 TRAP transporter large permease [Pelagibacterium halotolerans]SEA84327.1 C4-dicarboxylate transporter, DctM subunit [Pelagibacterium halotolerans]
MSEVALVLTTGFALLVILGVPFAVALGLCTVAALVVADVDLLVLPQMMLGGTQSFSLLAIPFFMLAGQIMTQGGLSQRIVDVADVLVRHLRGGLGHVTILAAAIFAAISGSAPATTAAVGSILIPAMVERGFSKPFATSLAVSAGVLGPMIPPSIAAVIWAVIAETSIAQLFIAGVGPAVLLIIGFMIITWFHAKKHNIPRMPRASWSEIRQAFRNGIWALMAPVLVLGGIYSGIFTPTEAGVASCLYAIVVGTFVERRIRLRDLPDIIMSAAKTSGMIMFIIAASSGFGWLVAQERLAVGAAEFLVSSVGEPWLVIIVLNIAIIIACAVMDEIAIMVILGPMFIALSQQIGMDPIQFGTIIVTNVAMGMATPPIGYCLFVGMAISNLSLGKLAKAIWPQLIIMAVVLMLVSFVPQVSMTLPSVFYG